MLYNGYLDFLVKKSQVIMTYHIKERQVKSHIDAKFGQNPTSNPLTINVSEDPATWYYLAVQILRVLQAVIYILTLVALF